ncbi:MAG: recombinase zinc beta ribbon domain-containing protein [Pseudomonadota bacterium]
MSHIHSIEIPPLVDDPTIMKAVQQRLDQNRKCKRRNSSNRYLLTGFIRCDKCNTPLMGVTQNKEKGWVYYSHVPRDCKDPGKANNIRQDVLERAVMEKLFEVFGDKAKMEESINREYGITKEEAERAKFEIKSKNAALRKAEKNWINFWMRYQKVF